MGVKTKKSLVFCALLLAFSIACSLLLNTVSFAENITVSITVPNGASVELFLQKNNYNVASVEAALVRKTGEYTVYAYETDLLYGLSYRVERDGYVTIAGYIQGDKNGEDINIRLDESDFEKTEMADTQNNVAVIENRLENSVLLGVNKKNFVHLQKGGEYEYSAYRAAWQIINSDTQNVVIEPNFSHEVVYGSDCVSIKNTADMGNAGKNIAILSAENDGIAIIEVSFDAISIGGDTRYMGRYGASEKNRNGALIVQVGGENASVDIGFDWDSERDTVYFLEETGSFEIAPTLEGDKVSEVAVLSLKDGENAHFERVFASSEKGVYNIPVKEGNNAVKITLESGSTDCFIVRGKRVEFDIKNANGSDIIKPGDSVEIHINGLYMPVPKMGGIYNPYKNRLVYTDEAGNEYSGESKQYDFAKKHSLDFTVPSDFSYDEFVLENGSIYTEMYCSQAFTHRDITKDGVGVNTNAVLVKKTYSVLPDIRIVLGENNSGEAKPLLGDVNADGKINSRDIAFLQRFVTGGATTDETEKATCDANGDGKVNSRDIAYIQKLIIAGI